MWLSERSGSSSEPHASVDRRMTQAQRRWALVAIAAGVCFGLITLWVTVFETLPGDNLVLRVARALHHRKLDRVMHDYSDLSELIVGIALLCAAWIAVANRGPRRRRALVLIAAVGASLAIKEITSQLVVRPGPQLYGVRTRSTERPTSTRADMPPRRSR